MAVGLSKLGTAAGFLGKVGDDAFGHFLQNQLKQAGVDTSHLQLTKEARTTLAFVSLTESGDRDFMFYRNPGADELLSADEIAENYIKESKVLHFGSLSLTSSSSRKATFKAIEYGQKYGLIISMDPNLRFSLWESKKQAKEVVLNSISQCNFLKLSLEEAGFLSENQNMEAACLFLLDLGPDLVVVTLGEQGCFYRRKADKGTVNGFKVEVKDTTGAGDAFTAGFISYLARKNLLSKFPSFGRKHLKEALRHGNAVAAITTTALGATTAFPNWPEVESFIRNQK